MLISPLVGTRWIAVVFAAAAVVLALPGSGRSADTTPPIVSYTIDGIAGTNGWYRGSTRGNFVTIHWSVSDPEGITSTTGCEPALRVKGPTTGTTRTCSATSDGGTTTVTTKKIKIDASPPTLLSPSPQRAADLNGWYDRALLVGWSGSDATSGIASCTVLSYSGPDSAHASVSGTCIDLAGNAANPRSFSFKYDGTPPSAVAATPSRAPDANGWYNHPVGVAWHGVDAASGIASCTSLTYSGPDDETASVLGSCRDLAGNGSATSAFALRYDQTPPAWKKLRLAGGNHRVVLTWNVAGSSDTEIARSPGLRGAATSVLYTGKARRFVDRKVRNGVKYRYALSASDPAGNTAARSAVAIPKAMLFAPGPGARVRATRAVYFAWQPAPGARYYNFQLWRSGAKVASYWPTKPQLLLRSPWSSVGGTHRLRPGRYAWYVWPGLGPRSRGRYGKLLGSSSFVVAR